MEFKNVDKFERWLKENLKNSESFDLDAYIEDVTRCYETSGTVGLNTYELKSYETKSGNSKLYYYEASEIYYNDDNVVEPCEDYDYVEVICDFK